MIFAFRHIVFPFFWHQSCPYTIQAFWRILSHLEFPRPALQNTLFICFFLLTFGRLRLMSWIFQSKTRPMDGLHGCKKIRERRIFQLKKTIQEVRCMENLDPRPENTHRKCSNIDTLSSFFVIPRKPRTISHIQLQGTMKSMRAAGCPDVPLGQSNPRLDKYSGKTIRPANMLWRCCTFDIRWHKWCNYTHLDDVYICIPVYPFSCKHPGIPTHFEHFLSRQSTYWCPFPGRHSTSMHLLWQSTNPPKNSFHATHQKDLIHYVCNWSPLF